MGTYTVTVTSQADPRAKATCTFTVRPTISLTPGNTQVWRRSQNTFTATVSGATNTGVTWSATGGSPTAGSGATLSWAAPDGPGSYTVTATSVADPSVSASTILAVVNRAPVFLGGLPSPGLQVNIYFAQSMPQATDADGDGISYGLAGLPPGMAFDSNTRMVSGTPAVSGTYSLNLTATDSLGASASISVNWDVQSIGGNGGGGTVTAPTPSLPANDGVFNKSRFSEVLGYGGSETGLITSVDVNRQLQVDIANLASGRDRAVRSTYSYGYDPLGQLVKADGNFLDANGGPVFTDNTAYTYDRHGNRTAHTPNANTRGGWSYQYFKTDGTVGAAGTAPGTNRLAKASDGIEGYKTFTYTLDGAVNSIQKENGETQSLTYGDPRFMRLPTLMNRTTLDGRAIESTMRYDMAGTRTYKRDKVTQGSEVVSDRETYYLANGTEVLMEVEKRGALGTLAADRYTAYIFGAGSRLARLSWDTDGQPSKPISLANAGFEAGPAGWTVVGTTAAKATDPTQGVVLRLPKGSGVTYVEQSLGIHAQGDTVDVSVLAKADSGAVSATVQLFQGSSVMAQSSASSTTEWAPLKVRGVLPSVGDVKVRLVALGAELQATYFDRVEVKKQPASTLVTGQPNLWPDPGFESVASQDADVEITGATAPSLEHDGSNREGLKVLKVPSDSLYKRTVRGLTPYAAYLFSVWKQPEGSVWQRESRPLNAAPDGTLEIQLTQAGRYDQAELIGGTYSTLPEAWIPENRLGRVDWFIVDHLGSTKLLIDQNGQHRFSGDDDPFGVNLRSFGDKDSHRYTGQMLDEDQRLYYYGARYYLPEIGRFLSGDPAGENHSSYVYASNNPLMVVDPDGRADKPATHQFINYALKADPVLYKIILASNNYSALQFEKDYYSGKLNNYTLRGLAGEAVVARAIMQRSLISGGKVEVQMQPKIVGTQPDLHVTIHHPGIDDIMLDNVASLPGVPPSPVKLTTFMNLIKSGGDINLFYEVKTGLSVKTLAKGADQTSETARNLKAAGIPGIAVLLVDKDVWAATSPLIQQGLISKVSGAGGYIQVAGLMGPAQATVSQTAARADAARPQDGGGPQ